MYISRYISSDPDNYNVPEQLWIRKEEFIAVVKNNSHFKARDSDEKDQTDFLFFENPDDQTELFSVKYYNGKCMVYYGQKITDDLIFQLNQLAIQLNSMLLSSIDYEFPKSKISAALNRIAKKNKQEIVQYQNDSFGENNIWLAFRADLNNVLEYLELNSVRRVSWEEGLSIMRMCKGVFAFEFRGWSFLAGQLIDGLFDHDVRGESALEKQKLERLLKWGKVFIDIQLYMHYDRSEYFNAYYRVLNGKLFYGEYFTESYQIKHGKMPKNIKDLPENVASTVASEWSYDPDYLCCCQELENAKVTILKLKSST